MFERPQDESRRASAAAWRSTDTENLIRKEVPPPRVPPQLDFYRGLMALGFVMVVVGTPVWPPLALGGFVAVIGSGLIIRFLRFHG